MRFSYNHLRIGGNLVFWYPVSKTELKGTVIHNWFLTKSYIFDQNWALWLKVIFLTISAIFEQNFDFLTKIVILDQNCNFARNLCFLSKIVNFDENCVFRLNLRCFYWRCNFWPKVRFLIKILFFFTKNFRIWVKTLPKPSSFWANLWLWTNVKHANFSNSSFVQKEKRFGNADRKRRKRHRWNSHVT